MWHALSSVADVRLTASLSLFQVQISKGHGSEEFRPAARVDAFDGSDAALATRLSRGAVGAAPEVLRTVLLGLSPGSDFDVRVTPISRYDAAKSDLQARSVGCEEGLIYERGRKGEKERGKAVVYIKYRWGSNVHGSELAQPCLGWPCRPIHVPPS